jgi:hypothetical protein
MGFTLLAVLLGTTVFFVWTLLEDPGEDFGTYLLSSFLGLAVGALVGILITDSATEIKLEEAELKRHSMTRIASATIDNSMEGTVSGFIVFSGTVDETEYYFCMKKRDDGGYERIKIPAEETVVYEDADENPRIVSYSQSTEDTFWTWEERKVTRYAMHIPRGSIVKKFEIR